MVVDDPPVEVLDNSSHAQFCLLTRHGCHCSSTRRSVGIGATLDERCQGSRPRQVDSAPTRSGHFAEAELGGSGHVMADGKVVSTQTRSPGNDSGSPPSAAPLARRLLRSAPSLVYRSSASSDRTGLRRKVELVTWRSLGGDVSPVRGRYLVTRRICVANSACSSAGNVCKSSSLTSSPSPTCTARPSLISSARNTRRVGSKPSNMESFR